MIRRRLVTAVSVVSAVAVLLGGWLVLLALEDRLVDNLDRDLRGGSLTMEIRDVLRRPGPGMFDRPRNRFDPVDDVAVVIYSPDGAVRRALPAGTADSPEPLPDAADLEPAAGLSTVGSDGGPRYRAAAIPTDGGGTAVIAASMATIDETLRDARRILAVFGVGAVGVIAVVSWLLIRRALAPVEGMVTTADRIAAGHLTERTDVVDDGSEVGRLGSALDTMLDRIEEAIDDRTESEARMRRFVAEASHELRTPLTSVRGYAELYRQGGDDPETVATSMERIEAEATRMSRLVEDLLLLARLDQSPSPARQLVDLGHVAGEAVDTARVVDPSRTWDLEVDARAELQVIGDPGALRQVFDNLLANARSHTPPGTTVCVHVGREVDRVVAEVVDDGPGLAPEDRERAFDRFWRSTRGDENPGAGTGLGLAIVRSIARAHGGDVALSEADGGGARFRVSLPAGSP